MTGDNSVNRKQRLHECHGPFKHPASRSKVLLTLYVLNFLTYIDRQVIYVLFPLMKRNLDLSDAQLGVLGSAFILIYALAAPPSGVLADRWLRTRFVAIGATLWSAATVLTGLCSSFFHVFLCRIFVGVGQGAYSPAAPSIIGDLYEEHRRSTAFSRFYAAIPVGSALGYALGGVLGEHLGWRHTLIVLGAPGILLGMAAWLMPEPFHHVRLTEPDDIERPLARDRSLGRIAAAGLTIKRTFSGWGSPRRAVHPGTTEEGAHSGAQGGEPISLRQALARILRVKSFLASVVSLTASTFTLGCVVAWLPEFLVRVQGMDVARAGIYSGGIVAVGSLLGTLAGGWFGSLLNARTSRGLLIVCAAGFLLGLPPSILFLTGGPWARPALFAAVFFLFFYPGPMNAHVINVIPPGMRATAFSLRIFSIHVFGDAVSPTLLGYMSDLFTSRGLTEAQALTRAFFMLMPAPLLLAGVAALLGCIWVGKDTEQAKADAAAHGHLAGC